MKIAYRRGGVAPLRYAGRAARNQQLGREMHIITGVTMQK